LSVIRRSVLYSVLDKYFVQILLIVTTAVMARLLTPTETGLYFIANSVIMLSENFRTFGVGIYLVQSHELKPTTIRSAFTVTLLMSLALMSIILLASGAIGAFYGDPDVARLLRIAALAFLVTPFATPAVALLQRELDFRNLAVLNVAAGLTNSAVTVALGLAGFGPMSYALGFLASCVVLSVLSFAIRPHAWMFQPSLSEARPILSFGALTSSVTVMNMAYEMLPRLALGKILAFDAVAVYARAVTICQLPDRAVVSAMHPVVLPAFAAHHRNGGELRSAYLHGVTLMTAVQWPMLIMLALLADPVVRILLGMQWVEAVPLVRMIALAMMALAPAFMTFPVLIAIGRVRDTLTLSLISLPPSVLLLIGAAHIDLKAVAAVMFFVAPFQMFVALVFVRRAIGFDWRELAVAARSSIGLAVGSAVVPLAVVMHSPTGFALSWTWTFVAGAGGAAGWAAALYASRHPARSEIASMVELLGSRLRRRRSAAVVQAE
jgi:O-antigen/teichoic acid export membrane protein